MVTGKTMIAEVGHERGGRSKSPTYGMAVDQMDGRSEGEVHRNPLLTPAISDPTKYLFLLSFCPKQSWWTATGIFLCGKEKEMSGRLDEEPK